MGIRRRKRREPDVGVAAFPHFVVERAGVAAIGQEQCAVAGKVVVDDLEDVPDRPTGGVFLAGIVRGKPSLIGLRVAIAVPCKVEDEEVSFVGLVEEFRETLLHAGLRRLRILQVNDLLVRHARIAEELHQLRVAPILHRRGKRRPNVGMLPFEQPDGKDPSALGVPVGLGRKCGTRLRQLDDE